MRGKQTSNIKLFILKFRGLKLFKKRLVKLIAYVFILFIFVVGTLYWQSGRSHATTDTFTASGTWTVPANVFSATFAAWGGGGAGGGATSNNTAGGGGAGGQYAVKNSYTVTPGDAYTVTVSGATTGTTGNGGAGGDSLVVNPSSVTIVQAKGGAGGTANNGAGGTGSSTGGVGDSVNAGGSGAAGAGSSGGGGGGAGSTGAGGSASGTTAGTGTSANGGNGGAGIASGGNIAGNNGLAYGGAGSGATRKNASQPGGAGEQGLVTVTYTVTPTTYNQTSYRLFDNANSVTPGSALAAQNTAATLSTTGQSFRLRQLIKPNLSVAAGSPYDANIVDSQASTGQDISVVQGGDGFARMAYMLGSNGNLKFAQCTNAACTTSNITTVDTAATVTTETSITMGSDGFARMAYYDTVSTNLKFAQCTNAACTTSNITTVDTATNVGRGSSIAMGSDGFARISYQDATTGSEHLKFAQCTNAACTTSNITTVDSTASAGTYTSMKLGSDGFARISYTVNGALKFTQCTNAACTTSNINTVDSTASESFPSLDMGSDGFARISYVGAGVNLKFAQCTNAACTTSNITTVDGSGKVGQYTSVAMASDGFARIAYFDANDGIIKFAQCTNAACSTSTLNSVATTATFAVTYDSLYLGSGDVVRIAFYDSTVTKPRLTGPTVGLFNEQYADLSSYGTCSAVPAGNWGNVGTDTAHTAGARLAGSGTSSGTGTAWSSPGNITAADSTETNATLSAGTFTNDLIASGFGFSIPAGATITGISATAGGAHDNTAGASFKTVKMEKAGVAGATNLAGTIFVVISPADYVFGGATNLWGDTWTPSDINNANFGVDIAMNGDTVPDVVGIDDVSITVYYTTPGGIGYTDNAAVASASAISSTGSDPTESGQTVAVQTYQESGGFYNTSTFGGTVDGEWDLSLHDNSAPASTTYCLRTVKSDGSALDTYTNYPQITTSSGNGPSANPTLLSPESGSTGQLTAPLFQLKSTDPESDYLQYKILLYNSDCSTGLQTFDQTASQNGWLQQTQQNSTAYTGGTSLGASSTAFFGGVSLSASTTYCWKAASIDPGGSNTFSSFSATQLFTTGSSSASGTIIQGGGSVTGGSIVR